MTAVADELRSLVDATTSRLAAVSEADASAKPYADKWSRKQILGHLIDSALNNHQRVVRMQGSPTIPAFGYKQDDWVITQHYQERSWGDLVDLWRAANLHLAHVIAHVNPAALGNTCDMGYEQPVTLKFFIEDYLRHLRHHLAQVLDGRDPQTRQ